jgi:electron transfer flavoprotein alpha/beta subunit
MGAHKIETWENRLKIADDYLELHRNLLETLEAELPTSITSDYWKKRIDIEQLKNDIEAKEYYIESLKKDKLQQDMERLKNREDAESFALEVLKKARSPLMRGDTKIQLEGLLNKKYEKGTDDWVKWIFRIKEVLDKTNA